MKNEIMEITQKDIKYLERITSKKYSRIALICLAFIAVSMLTTGVLNIYLAIDIAHKIGLSFKEFIAKWLEGVSSTKQYSGISIISYQRLQIGITQIILRFCMAIVSIFKIKDFKRQRRILKFIKRHITT